MEKKILLLGLDNAGKTSILYKLARLETASEPRKLKHKPTMGFNVKSIEHKNVKLNITDVGGGASLRSLWSDYYEENDGIIFVVDSADADRLKEAQDEMAKLLKEELLKDAVILIFANKQDLPKALPADKVRERFNSLCSSRTWTVIGCSAERGVGLEEGLNWLVSKYSS